MELFDVYSLYPVEPVRGSGSYVYDAAGTEYLDLYGGHAVISIGHAHPHYVRMISEQAARLGFYSNSVENSLQHTLAERLGALSGYDDYRLFLCNSGAEANENALKLASFHTGRAKVLAFGGAFHGRTSGAVEVTDNPAIRSPFNATANVEFVPLNDIGAVERKLAAREFAAVIVEGIQGVAGIRCPEEGFLRALREATERTGTVLILDEIQSGYGRTGRFFAHQWAGIRPDLITTAKGMGNGFPIGGVLIAPQFEARKGIDVLYKKNESNDIFTLTYVFDTGTENDPALNLAFNYLSYLGTDKMTAEEIASEMYDIACSFYMNAGANQSSIQITGLSENMGKAMEIVEGLIAGAKPDEAILENLKGDMLKSRADAKLNQSRCFGALQRYLFYGGDFIRRTTLTDPALQALTSEQLLAKIGGLMGKQHEVLYYGPQKETEIKSALAEHHKVAADLQPLEKKFSALLPTDANKVVLAQYDAKQLYYLQFSNRGEKFDVAADPEITLYNEYFGGGMNTIVFQEMREARGLAYSAWATLATPSNANGDYSYYAFIATQNDKMQKAVEAFDDIINNMPESEKAFGIAKEALVSRLRTERTVKDGVLWSYLRARDLGLDAPRDKQIFEKVQSMTLDDVKAAQQKWVKGRKYVYGILGDIQDLDLNYLKTLGPIQTVSQEEIFGY